MDDLEELKKRKEQLELERDIATLEREKRARDEIAVEWIVSEKLRNRARHRIVVLAKLSWLLVAPLGLLGAFIFIGLLTLNLSSLEFLIYGFTSGGLLLPLFAKVMGGRR